MTLPDRREGRCVSVVLAVDVSVSVKLLLLSVSTLPLNDSTLVSLRHGEESIECRHKSVLRHEDMSMKE